jgi:hypothetical protein
MHRLLAPLRWLRTHIRLIHDAEHEDDPREYDRAWDAYVRAEGDQNAS